MAHNSRVEPDFMVEDETLYEVMDSHQPVWPASIKEHHGGTLVHIPPPLPPRDQGMCKFSVQDNPSYLTKGQDTSFQPVKEHPSSPPPYELLASKPKQKQQSSSTLHEDVNEMSISKKSLSISNLGSREDLDQGEKKRAVNVASPSGYKIMDSLANGNIIFIVPEESLKKLPITASGKNVRGGGAYNDDSKFEVIVPRGHLSEHVIALRCVKGKERFLCIDSKGKIKMRDGYKDSCDFFVNRVGDGTSHIVCFESARTDGLFLGINTSTNATVDAGSITPESGEAHFTVMIDKMSEFLTASSKLRVFEADSVMNHVQGGSVVRLFSNRRYLGIDKKGRVIQTHNSDNQDCWFVFYDRGMGVVSLRSYKQTGYWLRLQDGELTGKGMLGPDALFNVKETSDHHVCLESILQSEVYVAPPLRNPALKTTPEFTLEVVI